ncbi:MAG: PMT-2 domain-containing protein [Oscillospiraceae bacterium]
MHQKVKHWKNYILYAPFLAAFIYWLIIYSYTFLQGDDYRFSIHGGSLPKIWEHYQDYYMYGGARMGNLLAGIFLMMDMRVWQVLTALVATAVSLTFFYYIRGSLHPSANPDRRTITLACVCTVFPGLLPMSSHLFSDSFLWLDGSTNYIYPFLLMLIGFVPFYNRLRGRSVPKIFSWLPPICFVAAVLLHEQITTMLLCMCIAALLYLKISTIKIPLSLKILTLINAFALIFMLTAPGAYFRMQQENGAEQSTITTIVRNFRYYFAPLINDYWPWLIAMGIAATFLLHRRIHRGKISFLIQLYLCFGALLIILSSSLRFPMLQLPQTSPQTGRYQQLAEIMLTVYWLLYILLIFAALLMNAKDKNSNVPKRNAYLPVLYVGMWASQAIPAVATTSSGRAKMPLYALALLMIFCILWDCGKEIRCAEILQGSLVLIGMVSFACIARGAAINGIAAANIEQQILKAQQGKQSTVLIDYNQFDWTYCNVTYNFKPDDSPHGFEAAMRIYYNLPDTVEFQYTKAEAGRGAKIYVHP